MIKTKIMANLGLLFGVMLVDATAQAFVPPADFILERTLKAREGLKSLELIAEIQDKVRQTTVQETLRLDFIGGRFWTVVTGSEGALALSRFGRLGELQDSAKAWIVLAYDPQEDRVRSILQKVASMKPSADSENGTRLVRVDKKIFWSWGTPGKVFIEKDQFVWAGTELETGLSVMVREQARFPRVISVKRDGQERFVYTLRQFKLNTPVKWNTQQQVEPQGTEVETVQDWVQLVR